MLAMTFLELRHSLKKGGLFWPWKGLSSLTPVNIRPQRGRLWSKPRGHDLRKSHWQNWKSEYRNSKQIQISNSLMTKTKSYSRSQIRLLFGSFEFWSLTIVSDFGFRAPGLESLHFIRQSHWTLTWPWGPGFLYWNKRGKGHFIFPLAIFRSSDIKGLTFSQYRRHERDGWLLASFHFLGSVN